MLFIAEKNEEDFVFISMKFRKFIINLIWEFFREAYCKSKNWSYHNEITGAGIYDFFTATLFGGDIRIESINLINECPLD